MVLLPPAFVQELSPAELEHVLLHELAHMRRRDLWVQAAVQALQALYWFYPPLIWARRRIAALCELCCDATVSEVLRHRTPAYRRTLLRCAWRMDARGADPALQMGLMAGPVGLIARLQHLEREPWRGARRRRWLTARALLLSAACILPGSHGHFRAIPDAVAEVYLCQARANLEAAAAGERRSCLQLQASARLLFGRTQVLPPPTSLRPQIPLP